MNRKKSWKRSAFSQLPDVEVTANVEKDLSTKGKPTNNINSKNLKEIKRKQCENIAPPAHFSMEVFAPKCLDELAVHAKKVEELHNWFRHCECVRRQTPAQICLLTGPVGAGKTAILRIIANNCKYELKEWINPIDQEVITSLSDQMVGSAYIGSQVEAFKNFLLRASRYKSLLDSGEKRLLMVEDFPNALLRDANSFESIMDEYLIYGKSPLVFIVADSKSRGLNISYNLFSEQIKNKFHINHISFNPIASTLMQKGVKRFCTIMQNPEYTDIYKIPAQNIVDSIVVSAQGDIRNALLNLHFAALKGAPSLLTTPVESECCSTNKIRKKQITTLKSLGRDESLTMLHALGRVFNPKFNDAHKFLHTPEDIAENFRTEPKKYIDFVHANYLAHFGDIEHVTAAASGLSMTDVILNEYRDEMLALIGLNVGIRSVMVSNVTPVKGWLPVHGPRRTKIPPNLIDNMSSGPVNITTKLYATDYSTYIKYIKGRK